MRLTTATKIQSERKLIVRSYSGQEQLSKEEIKVFCAATD